MFQSTLQPGQVPTNNTPLLEILVSDQPEAAPRASSAQLMLSDEEEGDEESSLGHQSRRQAMADPAIEVMMDTIEEGSIDFMDELMRTPPREGGMAHPKGETEVPRPGGGPVGEGDPTMPSTSVTPPSVDR